MTISRNKSVKTTSPKGKMTIYLSKSTRDGKKYMVNIDNRTIHFGQDGASDYTKHKDEDRKQRYLARHKKRENWGKSGIKTAGFWSRWLLWGETTLDGSIKKINKKFNVNIVRKRR